VAKICAEFGMDDVTIAAALLHDAVEDTGTTLEQVEREFGADVAAIGAARGQRVIGVGHAAGADLRIAGQRFDATGQDLRLLWAGRAHQVRLNLIGGFQAENVALAAGLVIASGSAPEDGVVKAAPVRPPSPAPPLPPRPPFESFEAFQAARAAASAVASARAASLSLSLTGRAEACED
jgi:UDP-N-acetylmuramyl pentapeptide synthase